MKQVTKVKYIVVGDWYYVEWKGDGYVSSCFCKTVNRDDTLEINLDRIESLIEKMNKDTNASCEWLSGARKTRIEGGSDE